MKCMIEKVLGRKKMIDDDLERMARAWRQEWETLYTPATLVVLDTLIDFLQRGGKRVRGALAMESYYLHGGKDEKVALGAARVMELIQGYLLIMDDIQDKSAMRRGGPTVHIQLANEYGPHYGIAQGLNAEMLANHRAIDELMSLPVDDKDKVRAAKLLAADISVTIVGQINDMYNEFTKTTVTNDAIIHTLTWKTAYYTFVSPLELGACLAGADGLNDRLRDYALNAGVAFQISDDILGVFGDSFEVGKSADDDIREGKATLLAIHALSHAAPEQRLALEDILGRSNATTIECDQVREIFEATGAHDYARAQATTYAKAAKEALGSDPEEFLVGLVDFAVSRKA